MGKTVWAMYFSGTGTTEKMATYIAKKIAEHMGTAYKAFDFTKPAARKDKRVFDSDDVVVLGTPVIAGRVPNLLLQYLNTIEGKGALGIPIVLYGNRNFDDALIELRDIMEADGFHTIAGGAFVGEHSFSTTLGRGRPDISDEREADKFVLAICDKVASGKLQDGPVEVEGQEPVRPYYTPRDRNGNNIDIRKVKPKTNENCDNCGLCAELCPLGSIDPKDCTQITGICMKCCACVKKCPKNAKYFDDRGYLYHKSELEELYGNRRAENKWFV